jgi:hypothetical protein
MDRGGGQLAVKASLDVKVRVGEGKVKLGQLRELADRLQKALTALASQLAESTTPGIDFEIVQAAVGSLSLGLKAVARQGARVDPEHVVATFTADLANIRKQSYRSDLTTGLTRHYRALVTSLKDSAAIVEYAHGRDRVVVDDAFRTGFEVALKERVAEDVSVVGYLDAVNAHKTPFVFYLYPKLEEGDRVECRFRADMLETVAGLLKHTVKATGTGYFAPVGIYPLRIEVSQAPLALAWDPSVLRSYVGKIKLVPPGMSASDYLQRNREAAGVGD